MFFDRSDKLFVTAAADDAQFDKLLTRFKRIRVGMTVAFISGLLILIILAAWLAIELLHVLRSPTFEMPPYLARLSTLGTPNIIFATIVGVSCFTGLPFCKRYFRFAIFLLLCVAAATVRRKHNSSIW